MPYELFSEVALKKDLPEKGLEKGDIATIVEHHLVSEGEDGYSLEVFNAIGDTIAIVTLPESQIEPLTKNEVLKTRSLAAA